MRPKTADYDKPVDLGGCDLMTIEEYLGAVECGALMDCDGMGEPVKDGKVALVPLNEKTGWPDWIYPSDGIDAIPEDATHIAWYNK